MGDRRANRIGAAGEEMKKKSPHEEKTEIGDGGELTPLSTDDTNRNKH